jgi:periplasmic copper chaperone A
MKPIVLLLAAASAASLYASSPSHATAGLGAPSHAVPARLVETVADQTYKVGALVIVAPWTRATPGGAQVGGGYLVVTNTGAEADRLIGGSLPIATSVEVHEMSMADGVMKMRKLDKGLEIEPGQTVELKPGGYHIMFMGLREGLKQGQPVKGTLVFEKAGTVEVEYRVAPIGAQSGDAGKKKQHQH